MKYLFRKEQVKQFCLPRVTSMMILAVFLFQQMPFMKLKKVIVTKLVRVNQQCFKLMVKFTLQLDLMVCLDVQFMFDAPKLYRINLRYSLYGSALIYLQLITN